MAAAPDHEVLARALSEDRTVITADTDFGTLLAQSGAALPSVILLRGPGNRRPGRQLLVLLASLPSLERALAAGSVVVIEGDRIRTRSLPITPAR
jgi:predicted nuclease of predicted toxin-antitoxin system